MQKCWNFSGTLNLNAQRGSKTRGKIVRNVPDAQAALKEEAKVLEMFLHFEILREALEEMPEMFRHFEILRGALKERQKC